MKVGSIVQARMGSHRLPGKVLLPLKGKPVLWHVLKRAQSCQKIEKVVLATSDLPEDKPLAKVADELGIETFFGSPKDVLKRYYQAAKKFEIDPVVRITADCPIIDPETVDEVIDYYFKGTYDKCGLSGDFPNGLDVVVFSFKALETAFNEAKLPSEREHVGGEFFEKQPDRFKLGRFTKFKDQRHYRWTLDEPVDYELLKHFFDALYDKNPLFSYKEIFKLLEARPELLKINDHIIRNEGYQISLKEDEEYLKEN